jgi:hypothetical protein
MVRVPPAAGGSKPDFEKIKVRAGRVPALTILPVAAGASALPGWADPFLEARCKAS